MRPSGVNYKSPSSTLFAVVIASVLLLPNAQPFALSDLMWSSGKQTAPTDPPSHASSPFGGGANSGPVDNGDIVRVAGGPERRLPDALIIGVKKGGTRALLEFMKMHPDVRAPGPEIHFFDRKFHRGFGWYRRRMPPTLAGQITMEKTPGYFVDPRVPSRVFQMNKDARLILVVRDPVTRALSDYAQAVDKKTEQAREPPPSEADAPPLLSPPSSASAPAAPRVKSFAELAFLPQSPGYVDTSWSAIKIGLYARHLANWLKYFPPKQILIVSGEELVAKPSSVIGQVQRFLGLAPVITSRHFYFNTTKGFPCVKKHWRTGRPHCLNSKKGRQHPNVGPKVIKRLKEFYRPFNEQFYRQTKLNFDWERL